MVGIYKITNIKNNKVYIGQSTDIKNRWKQHLKQLRENNHINKYLQDDYNIYGEESFIFEVVLKCRSNLLDAKEGQIIKQYNSCNRDKGYNIANVVCTRNPYKVKSNKVKPNKVNSTKTDELFIEYNKLCLNCDRNCKQSYKVIIDFCPKLAKK